MWSQFLFLDVTPRSREESTVFRRKLLRLSSDSNKVAAASFKTPLHSYQTSRHCIPEDNWIKRKDCLCVYETCRTYEKNNSVKRRVLSNVASSRPKDLSIYFYLSNRASVLWGTEWSFSRPGRFVSKKETPIRTQGRSERSGFRGTRNFSYQYYGYLKASIARTWKECFSLLAFCFVWYVTVYRLILRAKKQNLCWCAALSTGYRQWRLLGLTHGRAGFEIIVWLMRRSN